jgi:sugar phosphate permease
MPVLLVLHVFIPLATGYFITSSFRSITAVISPVLVQDLNLTAMELGFLVSFFYICAALMQLRYGVLLDRYDPRRLYACFLFMLTCIT